ncbi:hypothetical protein [Microvirga calopogonii]|uniref:hypothetical protein n=1 Tax=Microvirga calopogonii TaxID=2078013 RepID=UPI0013B4609E|nr:hypothetical protein [Microvirga calopogonii]
MFTTFYISIKFIFLRYGLVFPGYGLFALSCGALAAILFARSIRPSPFLLSRTDITASAVVVGLFGLLVGAEFSSGYILPVHDPIAVPIFGQIIAGGRLPMDVYQPGDSGFTYPPGYPILISPLFGFASKYRILFLFKLLNLAVVVATPAVWAWGIARLFPSKIRPSLLLAGTYVAFFGLERTLPFTLPFAGKNAMLLAGLLCPIIIVVLLESSRSLWQFAIGTVALFGLTLIHFSALHMTAALLAGYLLVRLIERDIDLRQIVLLGAAGVLTAIGILFTLQEVVRDPRAGGFGSPEILSGLSLMAAAFTSEQNWLMTIYASQDFGVAGSPYKGLQLLLCFGGPLLASWLVPSSKNLRALRQISIAFFTALVLSLAFAFRVIPAGIQAEFVGWYLFFLQAGLFTSGILTVLVLAREGNILTRRIFTAAAIVGGLSAVALISFDTVHYTKWNNSQRVSKADLSQVAHTISDAAEGRQCLLISESIGMVNDFVIFQLAKPLEYVEYLTNCNFVNGSYVHRSLPHARDLDGMPPPSILTSLPSDAAILVIAQPERLQKYTAQLNDANLAHKLTALGTTAGLGVWRITLGDAERTVPPGP